MEILKRVLGGAINFSIPIAVTIIGFKMHFASMNHTQISLLLWGMHLSFLIVTILSIKRGSPGDVFLGIYYSTDRSNHLLKYLLLYRAIIGSCFFYGVWASANFVTYGAILIPAILVFFVKISGPTETFYLIDKITATSQVTRDEFFEKQTEN